MKECIRSRSLFPRNYFLSVLPLSLLTCVLAVVSGQAAPITAGDVVIYRVGDGATALGTTAASVFLDEYTAAGSLVQSINVTTAGGNAFSATGNSTTEGIISRSQDGTSLVYTGYRKAAGGTSPASDTYLTTSRVIGTLTAAGTVNTATTIINDNGSTTANAIRSATSVDGTSAFWVSTATRVSYYGSAIGSSAGTVQIDARNSRQVNLSGNTLFAANGSTAIPGKVQSYGTLPTGATVASPIVSLATADAVNSFVMFDMYAGIAGDDTLYALDTVTSTLLKYSFDGTSWLANGSISTTALNITGFANGGTVSLFLTTGSSLLAETDTSGYNATINGSISTLATAGVNTAFRGIGMFSPTPVPEPATLALGAVGLGLLVIFRRRA